MAIASEAKPSASVRFLFTTLFLCLRPYKLRSQRIAELRTDTAMNITTITSPLFHRVVRNLWQLSSYPVVILM
jgi:hypothetical protein